VTACNADEFGTNCEEVDASGTETVGQTLENELRVLVKVGLPEARTVLLPQLFDLRCVRQEVRGDGANDSVLALEHALKEAVALLGEGDRADAARALLGLDPRTRSFKRPRRREAAKNFLLGPGYDTQTFRRRYEEALISDVAYALHKLESHVRLGFPLTRDELENLGAGPRRSEPHDGGDEGFRLIRTSGELKATLFHI